MDHRRHVNHDEAGPATGSPTWARYYVATRERPPRPLLLRALEHGAPTGDALDLGCGAGNDTRFLLELGYRVVAVDADAGAIAALADIGTNALQTVHTRFEDHDFPPLAFDLVNAQLSLPFTTPLAFPHVMGRVLSSLRPGGVFTGQLFGPNDWWNVAGSPLTFVSRDEAQHQFAGYTLLYFEEREGEVTLASGETHHAHAFDIIARKPA